MRPTLKSIAEITGLGITTVSRALKDAPDIGADTKARVRDVARELGYQPDRAGLRLRTGKTYVISLIMSLEEEVMGVTSPVVMGISEVLAGTPYQLLVLPYKKTDDPLAPVRYVLETGAADGIILSRTQPGDARVRLLLEHGLPFATHGRTTLDSVHPFHDFDNEAFAFEAVRRLAERGRRRIALVPPPPDLTYHAHLRSGFEAGLLAFGLKECSLGALTSDDCLLTIRDACQTLFARADAPDGIVSSASSSTTALVAGLDLAGRRLGADVDIVTKTPNDVLLWLRPELITIREDFRLAGRELARAVLARIDGESPETLTSLSSF
ncbi:LacI family transcriptional regulator [Rhizobium sp. RU20A]|uniref:LacI family transcriptional regulator n=1 Tax=Rhizobium sp. RU20A TaxID=1907412 RepID=UPI00122CA425|nr:LacI family transcriptional regulator [Rhizobium sp. RU20A]